MKAAGEQPPAAAPSGAAAAAGEPGGAGSPAAGGGRRRPRASGEQSPQQPSGKKKRGNPLAQAVTAAMREKDLRAAMAAFRARPPDATVHLNMYGQLMAVADTALTERRVTPQEARDCCDELLREARRSQQGLRESVLAVALRLYARSGAPAQARALLGELRAAQGEAQRGGAKPVKLRWVLPIAEAAAAAGDCALAEEVFAAEALGQLQQHGAPLTYAEERQWAQLCAFRMDAAVKCGGERGAEVVHRALSDLGSVRDCLYTEEEAVHASVLAALSSLGLTVCDTTVDPSTGECAVTGRRLQGRGLGQSELRRLLRLVQRLVLEAAAHPGAREEWGAVRRRLRRHRGGWDAIIDAANVGHSGQNTEGGLFSHEQIDSCVGALAAQGRRPLVVLRGAWFDPTKDLRVRKSKKARPGQLQGAADPLAAQLEDGGSDGSGSGPAAGAADDGDSACSFEAQGEEGEEEEGEEEEGEEECPAADAPLTEKEKKRQWAQPPAVRQRVWELKQKWRKGGQLLVAPWGLNDDWLILFVAIGMQLRGDPKVQLVSNDLFRDHLWRIRGSSESDGRLLVRWMGQHVTRFRVQAGALELLPPPPYSVCLQRSPDGAAWHIPVRETAPREGDEQDASGAPRHDGGGPAVLESKWLVAHRPAPAPAAAAAAAGWAPAAAPGA
eukprot:TRINITY_DN15853_c0_g1_i1.p1 TRINITY_DN15853_c0_g1~~TRINITY_DN15853_c0_g1_i1.p1  ORF type:complete len:693 (+),score=276.81 TRINITY_DN15853_c0_g1_i1:70-2079(+)